MNPLPALIVMMFLSVAVPSFAEVNKSKIAAAQAATVIIRTPFGGGSGFIAEMGGKKYIVTNQHVLMGAQATAIKFASSSGAILRPVKAEIAAGETDLVRLEVATDIPPVKISAAEPAAASSVVAIGNSLDAGVITINPGTIVGVGPKDIEADCKFVPGNSGGPLIDEAGEAIAVPTLIIFGKKERSTEGTRYAENRRFSTRIRPDTPWVGVTNWRKYAEIGAAIELANTTAHEVDAAADIVIANSSRRFSPNDPGVASAMDAYERLRNKIAGMEGQLVTQQELQRNNNILAATYRVSAQKLRNVLSPRIAALQSFKVLPEWQWIEAQKSAALSRLESLYSELDAETRSRPKFMSFN